MRNAKQILNCAVASLLLSGCASSTDPNALGSRVRSTRMGPSHYMVSCVDSTSSCADRAASLCSQGFETLNNVFNADSGRMTMVVKCFTEREIVPTGN